MVFAVHQVPRWTHSAPSHRSANVLTKIMKSPASVRSGQVAWQTLNFQFLMTVVLLLCHIFRNEITQPSMSFMPTNSQGIRDKLTYFLCHYHRLKCFPICCWTSLIGDGFSQLFDSIGMKIDAVTMAYSIWMAGSSKKDLWISWNKNRFQSKSQQISRLH